MDVRTIYALLKPHLENMNISEKRNLSNLISEIPGTKPPGNSKRISLNQAKEKLKEFRNNSDA